LGRPAESAERGPGPSQPPEIASDPEGVAITDPSPYPLPREREMWIGRLASFNQLAGWAAFSEEARRQRWIQ